MESDAVFKFLFGLVRSEVVSRHTHKLSQKLSSVEGHAVAMLIVKTLEGIGLIITSTYSHRSLK